MANDGDMTDDDCLCLTDRDGDRQGTCVLVACVKRCDLVLFLICAGDMTEVICA